MNCSAAVALRAEGLYASLGSGAGRTAVLHGLSWPLRRGSGPALSAPTARQVHVAQVPGRGAALHGNGGAGWDQPLAKLPVGNAPASWPGWGRTRPRPMT